jgi:hypothetical protein
VREVSFVLEPRGVELDDRGVRSLKGIGDRRLFAVRQ